MTVPQGKKTVSDEDFIELMRERSDPAYTAPELADIFGMTHNSVRMRLQQIADEREEIKYKKASSRAVIFWHQSDESDEMVSK